MKKRLLFILLLLIPFMVNALDINNYNMKWVVEDENSYDGSYNTNNAFIYYTSDSITSIDKYTGARKEIIISENSPHLMLDDKIFVFSNGMYSNAKITIYDEHLNQLKKVKTEIENINYISIYDDDYILLSGVKQENDSYYLVILFIDKDGNIAKTDEYKTFNYVGTYSYNTRRVFYADGNLNSYKIEDYKIVPMNMNSDGTHMYLTNDKLYKVSNSGEILDSVDIPNGRSTRIAKKGDYYYLATGVYEDVDDDKTSVSLKIYKIDEELNIVATKDIEAPNFTFDFRVNEYGMSHSNHAIFYSETSGLYAYIIKDDRTKICYKISEDLEITTSNNYTTLTYESYNRSINGIYNFSLISKEEMIELEQHYSISDEERGNIKATLENDEHYKRFNAIKYNNGYLVLENYYNCEGTGCSADNIMNGETTVKSKYDLVYLDSNFNIVKRKTIYDWEYLLEYYSEDSPNNLLNKRQYINIMPYGEYLILLGTASSKNILYIMDQDWNIVKDFSKDIEKYEDFSAAAIASGEKGFYISLGNYGLFKFSDSKGATATIKNGLVNDKITTRVLDTNLNLNGINTVILYYSINYNIDKNITGKGTITSTVEKADEGEVVRFTVTPEDGYVLSVVKVTDANGNVLTFTDNTFVMPASNVVIEATFVPKNPNTGDIAILVICLIALSSFIIFALEKRRLNTLK